MTKSSSRIPVAILGSGNIGTDLLYKLRRNPRFDLRLLAGIDAASEGLARARELGCATSSDASAQTHRANAPCFKEAGIFAIDMTAAKVGPSIVPCVNMRDHFEEAQRLGALMRKAA